MKFKSVLCFLSAWPLVVCNAGTVRLFNGENYEAKVSIEGGSITAARDNSSSNRLETNGILEAVFNKGTAGFCQPGVLLINGTLIPGDVRLPLTEPSIKIGKTQLTIPTASIARVIFRRMPSDAVLGVLSGSSGVILANGDFFSGTYEGLKENKVAINSNLFGPARFQITEIGGIVLRDVQNVSARYEITSNDGARFASDDPRIEGDSIIIRDSLIGSQKIPKDEISVFRAGNGRYQGVAKLKPLSVLGPAGATNLLHTLPGSPMDADQTQVILSAVNASVSYSIPAGATRFASRVMVPKEVPPTTRFFFSVYVDNRLITRSSAIGSSDVPQTLGISFNAGQILTLRVEPAGPVAGAPSGNWIEPLLLKP